MRTALPYRTKVYWICRPGPARPVESSERMAAKKKVFSIVKAVKENSRDSLGQPPPERVLPDPKQKALAKPRHKETLADILEKAETTD